ncbi:putative inositol monophosphatase 3 [Rhynchophorus ferrugineus]|uniref:putative inositol monophosphatase 3 n=1 Tax=Rhynchophorus ferrugineus TaxID=354439 RepID=UPI003FCCF5B6
MFVGSGVKCNSRGYLLLCLIFLIVIYYHFISDFKTNSNNTIALSLLLQTAISAAETGGRRVILVRDNPEIFSKGKTKEGLEDSVTNADFLSHCAMKHVLTSQFPTVKFISEEKDLGCMHDIPKQQITTPHILDGSVNTKDVTIWIDPLDATHEYTEKLFQYVTTMVCVAVEGKPIIGVIHSPFENKTSWAVVGKGVSKDLKQKNVDRSGNDIEIIVSRSHRGTVEEALAKSFTNYKVVIAAGAGYKALKVAHNQVDAYIHTTAIKKWDICAGNAILNALGGKMTTKHGQVLNYLSDNEFVNTDGLIATLRNHDFFVNKL